MHNLESSLCIETVRGNLVNPSDPDPAMICVDDIAWALSRIPRFAGHTFTEVPYNVAQHSVYVSELVEDLIKGRNFEAQMNEEVIAAGQLIARQSGYKSPTLIKALFHDGHEAYFGDIPSPIKKIPELTMTFKALEQKLDVAIFEHLHLEETSETEKIVIKYCDKLAQAIEGYQFMPSRGRHWVLPKPTLVLLQKFPDPLTPLESYKAFLKRFEYLSGQ